METTTDAKSTVTLIQQILSNRTLFVATISYAFSPVMSKSLHALLEKSAPAEVNYCCHHCWNATPTASLSSYPLFGLHKHSASICECWWVQFFPYRSSSALLHLHFYVKCHFVRLLLSLSVICLMATKCNGILLRRFSLYCHTTSISLWYCGLI